MSRSKTPLHRGPETSPAFDPRRKTAPAGASADCRFDASERAALVSAVESRFGLKLLAGVQTVLWATAERMLDKEQIKLRELIHRLEGGSESDPMVTRMREAASIGETYFFRAPDQLKALQARVLDWIIPKKRAAGQRFLRIWSAACSTGEEPYTLAILFRLALPDFDVSVLGTDMNEASLAVARAGLYPPRSFRQMDAKSLAGMLVEDGRKWSVSDEIRRLVTFQRLNLVTDNFPIQERLICGFDVIVCRNVLIYLDHARIPSVMAKLAASCAKTGIIALTPAEYAAARHAVGFTDVSQGILVRGHEAAPRPSAPVPPPAPSAPRAAAPLPAPTTSRPPALEPARAFAAALESAREAADRGAFDEAREFISAAQSLRPDAAEPYYLLGTTFNALGDWQQAVREFQRAIYLDRDLAAAELGLGQALFTGRQRPEAKRHFRRALRLLEGLPEESIVTAMSMTVSVARRIAASWLEESR
jgi:chemotaxis protein methyltransferase CheR